jgi:AcrR family transcriptional regulator
LPTTAEITENPMPRPRFQKLPEEKRHHIIETAAKVFAAHGYDGASLNQILEQAGISKGAAYYYFDDKADFFLTTFNYYFEQMTGFGTLPLDELTIENFWTELKAVYRQPFLRAYDKPWIIGMMRAANQLAQNTPDHPLLQGSMPLIMNFLTEIIHRGQSLGVVRTDLPENLLVALIMGFDNASDDWLLRHWDKIPREELEIIVVRIADTLQTLMSPPPT